MASRANSVHGRSRLGGSWGAATRGRVRDDRVVRIACGPDGKLVLVPPSSVSPILKYRCRHTENSSRSPAGGATPMPKAKKGKKGKKGRGKR